MRLSNLPENKQPILDRIPIQTQKIHFQIPCFNHTALLPTRLKSGAINQNGEMHAANVKNAFVCRVLSSKAIFDNIFWLAFMKTKALIPTEAFMMEGAGSLFCLLVCF